MPGETMDDAFRATRELMQRRIGTVLTLLGENVTEPAESVAVVEHYQRVLKAVVERRYDAEISVKPTQLGLDLGAELAEANLRAILNTASQAGTMVWIDMESSAYVDATLELYRAVRGEFEGVGLCLQAYLYRTEGDLKGLLPLRPAIRLVKGAYREAADVAFPRKRDVDEQYARLGVILLDAVRDDGIRVAFGTHDMRLVERLRAAAAERGLSRGDLEVQMLYGIGTTHQERLAREGHTVRVLISYGEAWFPWYMRRLAERPANLWFVVRNVFGG